MTEFKSLPNHCNQILPTIVLFEVMFVLTQTGQYYRDTGNADSQEQYKDGCTLFVFNLTSQMDSSEFGFKLIKRGNICIKIHFATTTARTLTVIVFAEHDNLLEID